MFSHTGGSRGGRTTTTFCLRAKRKDLFCFLSSLALGGSQAGRKRPGSPVMFTYTGGSRGGRTTTTTTTQQHLPLFRPISRLPLTLSAIINNNKHNNNHNFNNYSHYFNHNNNSKNSSNNNRNNNNSNRATTTSTTTTTTTTAYTSPSHETHPDLHPLKTENSWP